jgi:hypothetical protein
MHWLSWLMAVLNWPITQLNIILRSSL